MGIIISSFVNIVNDDDDDFVFPVSSVASISKFLIIIVSDFLKLLLVKRYLE